jgi:carbonic anhydrase/acetyltransferase-like protein (isoleucine patch superfamily)
MTIFTLEGVTPQVSPRAAFIAPDARVIGRVEVEAGCGIWFGAVLRGDNELIRIEEEANVQDLCMLHTDPGFPLAVGRGCTIGHRAILHGCSIGENTLVGMGAIILNGAKIGRNCLIGAGALVPEGHEAPDGTLLVGVPARPVRSLDDDAKEMIRDSARHYVRNGQRFTAGLKIAPG